LIITNIIPRMRWRFFSSVFSARTQLFSDRSNQTLFLPAFLFLALFPAEGFGQSLLVDQSFQNSTAPGWTLQNSALLTSGNVDPDGAGWLRLTPASNSTKGFAYLNQAVPLSYGLDIRVQFQTWGGTSSPTGGDGLALSLFDGAVTAPMQGSSGAALGYAQAPAPVTPAVPGMVGGILGIGLDEYGAFAGNPNQPNSVTLRGPGNGSAQTAGNYGFLDSASATSTYSIQTGTQGQTVRPTGAGNLRFAEFIVGTNDLAQGKVPVTVILSNGTTSSTIVDKFNIYSQLVAFYGSAAAIPATFDVAFTSSTGGANDNHEIRDLYVTSLVTVPGFSPVDAGAGADNFVGVGTAAWETGGNWDSGVTPTSTEDAFVNNGGNALLTTAAAVKRLDIAAAVSDASGTVTIQGVGNLAAGTDVSVGENGNGTLSITGGGTLTSTNGIIGELSGSSGTATVNGTGSSWTTGNLDVGQSGTGILNVQTGGIVSVTGTLTLGSNVGATGTLNLSTGGILRLGGTNGLAAGAGTAVFNFAGGTLQVQGANLTSSVAVVLTTTGSTIDSNGFNAAFSGGFTGNGALTKIGTGTLTLSGVNMYSGATTVSAGTLQSGSTTAFSANSDFTVNTSTTLDLNGSSNSVGSLAGSGTVLDGTGTAKAAATLDARGDSSPGTTFSGTLINGTGTLALTKSGTGTLTLTGANTYTGGTTISGGTLQIGTGGSIVGSVIDQTALAFNSSGALALAISVSGAGTVSQIGNGTTTLSGTNNYSGVTTVSAGTLQAGSNSAFSASSDFAVNSTLDLHGFPNAVGSLAGLSTGNVTNNGGTAATLTAGGKNTTSSFNGTLTDGTTGTLGFTKTGTGTQTLSGNSTYTGATTVSAGTLQVDGGLGNTAVTVQTGGVLAGKGTIAGSVTILDGGLAPGPGAQTLGVGDLALSSGSILDYQLSNAGVIGSGVNSLVNVTGNLMLDGVLNVTNGGLFSSGLYRLVNYSGALTNNTLNLGILPFGFSAANVAVNAAILGQVNLVVNKLGAATQFWDGTNTVNVATIHGGNGTWSDFVTTNWTDAAGTTNQAWQNGVAVFAVAPGIVTLGSDILYQGMEFSTDGYSVVGDAQGNFALHPTGLAKITTDTGVTATISAPIAGAGGLEKDGPGLLILAGTNTFSGGITISAGTLSVGSDTNLGDPGVGVTLNGGELLTSATFTTPRSVVLIPLSGTKTLAAALNTTATYAGIISGAGALTVGDLHNQGTVVLNHANNSYGGGTNVLPGILVAASSGALGSGIVQIFNGTLTIPAGVSLSNEVTFVSGGVLNIAGTLHNSVLGGGATDTVHLVTGSAISGNLALSGSTSSTLILDGNGAQLFSLAVTGAVTNNGALVKQGSGTWTIDRALAAPIGTDILAGTLAVGAALTSPQVNISAGATLQLNTGGTVGNLLDNGSVIFTGSDTVNRSGLISGQGNVIQNGPGTTILSGRNTYSGGTLVDLGALLVNNPQALGTGNVTVNGGVLGADPQPINVLGNYTQNSGGTLQLNISGRVPGQFDVLNVAGNAALNGTLRLLNLGYQPQYGDKLRLVSIGGALSGRFAHFQNPFTFSDGFNTIALVYAPNSVILEFLRTKTGGVISSTLFDSFAQTPNQQAAASLLDAVQLDPRAANLTAFLATVPFVEVPNTFREISPEGLTAFYEITFSNANIQRLNLENRMDDLHHGSNGFSSNMKVNSATVNTEERVDADGKSSKAAVEPILQPGPGNRWGVWMTGFGDFVSVDGDANADGYNFTTGGVSLGIDYRLTDELVVGVMAEYSHTWTSLKPSGSNDVNSARGGLYATWSHHGFYLNGAIYGGYNSYNSSRSALQGLASGNTEGAELSTFISGGYDFHFGLLTVGPIAALQYTYTNIDGFSESGSLAPMQIQSGSANSLRSDIGFRLFYQWLLGKIIVEPSIKAAWEHEYFYSALPITAGFANIPGPTATFTGPAEGHDSAIVSAGVSVIWTPTLTTYLNYDGQLGRGNYSSNAVTGGVRISF
jgi:outer membrane autotransporter protein